MRRIIQKPKVITVDRATWLTKDVQMAVNVHSALLDSETGFMCCLGFACQQSRIPKRLIVDVGAPDDIDGLTIPEVPEWLTGSTAQKMMQVNDSGWYAPKEREAKLKELAKLEGVTLRFVGRYPSANALKTLKAKVNK